MYQSIFIHSFIKDLKINKHILNLLATFCVSFLLQAISFRDLAHQAKHVVTESPRAAAAVGFGAIGTVWVLYRPTIFSEQVVNKESQKIKHFGINALVGGAAFALGAGVRTVVGKFVATEIVKTGTAVVAVTGAVLGSTYLLLAKLYLTKAK